MKTLQEKKIEKLEDIVEFLNGLSLSDSEDYRKRKQLFTELAAFDKEIEQGEQPKDGMKESQSADLLDFQQYITNLLYAAYSFVHGNATEFDKWVEEQTELMEQYHNSKRINTDYLVKILKRTLGGNSDVKVEFDNESDNINFILDVCNNFKLELELEKDKDCFQQGIEDLCQEVLRKGVPLPIYDYNYKKFISSYPANININNQISGIEKSEMFDTFRDACLWIINND